MTLRDRTPGHNGRVVSQVIDALIAGRGIRPEDVYLAAGLTRSTFYNRMAKGDWKVDELADIAEYLNEPIGSFFDGLGGRFSGLPRTADNTSGTVRDTSGYEALAA